MPLSNNRRGPISADLTMTHAPTLEEVQDYAYGLFLFIVPESYATGAHGIASIRTTTGHTLDCWFEPNGIYGEY